MWLVESGHVWRDGTCCPVPLSHSGSEFTCSRQRQLWASTFGRRGESLSGLRSSAVLLLVAPEVPTVPSASVPAWREIWERAVAAAWLSETPERQAQSLVSQNALWNMAVGASTGQHQASFSTSCLSMTCSDFKGLFHSNCSSYYSY